MEDYEPLGRSLNHGKAPVPAENYKQDGVLAAELMAKVLADKGYHYQFVFARNSKPVDWPTVTQTLPHALEWLWKGYPIP